MGGLQFNCTVASLNFVDKDIIPQRQRVEHTLGKVPHLTRTKILLCADAKPAAGGFSQLWIYRDKSKVCNHCWPLRDRTPEDKARKAVPERPMAHCVHL